LTAASSSLNASALAANCTVTRALSAPGISGGEISTLETSNWLIGSPGGIERGEELAALDRQKLIEPDHAGHARNRPGTGGTAGRERLLIGRGSSRPARIANGVSMC
jgi:hypothetical protein